MADDPPGNGDTAPAEPLDALKQASVDEAEAQAALAAARAEAARARAALLRRQAEAGIAPAVDAAGPSGPALQPPPAPGGANTPRWRPIALGAALLAVCGLLGLSGAMAWQHHGANQERARLAEYAAVARQGVVNLMSLDFTDAQENVQRVIDSATGSFKEEFEAQADGLITSLEDAKVITEVTVDSVAVENTESDAPVVLVAAQSQATNAEDARKDPQRFRIAVTLGREGGELKIADVEFV